MVASLPMKMGGEDEQTMIRRKTGVAGRCGARATFTVHSPQETTLFAFRPPSSQWCCHLRSSACERARVFECDCRGCLTTR